MRCVLSLFVLLLLFLCYTSEGAYLSEMGKLVYLVTLSRYFLMCSLWYRITIQDWVQLHSSPQCVTNARNFIFEFINDVRHDQIHARESYFPPIQKWQENNHVTCLCIFAHLTELLSNHVLSFSQVNSLHALLLVLTTVSL